jgi:hypothetical protein
MERELQALAEESMADFYRRCEHLPVILMALRLLDYSVRYDLKLKKLNVPTRPYATAWLNLLGDLLHDRHNSARAIQRDLERSGLELAEKLQEEYQEISKLLENEDAQPNPVWRLGEALTSLQGRGNTQKHILELIDSSLHVDRPNGLAIKRRVMRKESRGGARRVSDLRSLVFTDAVLDYLVHLHLLPNGNKRGRRTLSFKEFIQILRERYGFCIDEAPPGMTISNEHLQRNRRVLERRLRDLGLLVGVNDAEAMKNLRSRFEHVEGPENVLE